MKKSILFVCIHNSARSQMAEAFVNRFAADRFIAESAGIEPSKLNPVVVEAMKEIGIDISANKTKSVHDFIATGKRFDYIVTVCDETSAERCPVFPGKGKRLHFGFADPSALSGSFEEKLTKTRVIRDKIGSTIKAWIKKLSTNETQE